MLQVTKNKLVTGVVTNQVEVRQLELDWYCGNYSVMNGQAAMLAGFAFTALTTPIPEGDLAPTFWIQFAYLFLVCCAIGFELSAIVMSTSLSVWAPSLALRGKHGTISLHKAVDCLRDYQLLVFSYFIGGWVIIFMTSTLQVWIYFRWKVAVAVTVPMTCFILAIIWYTVRICLDLHVPDDQIVHGKIDHFSPYEVVDDLDFSLQEPGRRAEDSYVPINADNHNAVSTAMKDDFPGADHSFFTGTC